MNKIKLTIEQMFDIITLGSLPGVIIFLLNRASQYVSRYWRWKLTLELEECIKDAFDASLEEYMKSKDYIAERQKTTEKLKTFRAGLSDIQQQQFNEIIDAISDDNSKLASEAYMHGVVEGIALRGKVIG